MKFFDLEKITTILYLTRIRMPVRQSKYINSIARNKFKKKMAINFGSYYYQRLKLNFHPIWVIRLRNFDSMALIRLRLFVFFCCRAEQYSYCFKFVLTQLPALSN